MRIPFDNAQRAQAASGGRGGGLGGSRSSAAAAPRLVRGGMRPQAVVAGAKSSRAFVCTGWIARSGRGLRVEPRDRHGPPAP